MLAVERKNTKTCYSDEQTQTFNNESRQENVIIAVMASIFRACPRSCPPCEPNHFLMRRVDVIHSMLLRVHILKDSRRVLTFCWWSMSRLLTAMNLSLAVKDISGFVMIVRILLMTFSRFLFFYESPLHNFGNRLAQIHKFTDLFDLLWVFCFSCFLSSFYHLSRQFSHDILVL